MINLPILPSGIGITSASEWEKKDRVSFLAKDCHFFAFDPGKPLTSRKGLPGRIRGQRQIDSGNVGLGAIYLELLNVFGDKALKCPKSDSIIPRQLEARNGRKLSSFRRMARTAKLRNKTEVLAEVFAQAGNFVLRGKLVCASFPWGILSDAQLVSAPTPIFPIPSETLHTNPYLDGLGQCGTGLLIGNFRIGFALDGRRTDEGLAVFEFLQGEPAEKGVGNLYSILSNRSNEFLQEAAFALPHGVVASSEAWCGEIKRFHQVNFVVCNMHPKRAVAVSKDAARSFLTRTRARPGGWSGR
jgi:hypothetical protein